MIKELSPFAGWQFFIPIYAILSPCGIVLDSEIKIVQEF